ncbi:aldehyde dehydrogenase [Neisseria arctica]|uniref:Aldehyde dehydrogenase n=1 Tax=Neisseria arctica TaxID=1470200 RepID=A0A0J1C2Q5_9NEIS|nr:coniferyl aldehyde dehydrogenase [Neisseria arctica]KLT72553.1 aldehyde dehydrogenase [Neisseria arctica]UOO87606.1 coniferyl aldehyde dehydrogenase [Neisseria arctica]
MNNNDLQKRFNEIFQASRMQTDVAWALRAQRLQRLEHMVRDNEAALVKVICTDFGNRSRHETALLEVFPTLAAIRHALKHGRRWMKPRKVATDWWFWPARNRIIPQPLGIIGIVAPWNYPLFLTTGPLVGALAAGNRVMIKTSEFAPAFAQWLSETVPQYFAKDEVAVINGGADTAAAFCSLPFDHLLFTGSTEIGRKVMQAAAENLTPVTLELGGKSPALVLPDADLPHAVARIMAGKLLNAGQTCIAPDYVLLPQNLVGEFTLQARQWVSKHYPDYENNPDYTHIINEKQTGRLKAMLAEAQTARAKIEALGPVSANSNCLPPHLIRNAPDTTALMQEEIFGPLLPLVAYETPSHALSYIRSRPRPLALYVFGQNKGEIENVLRQSVSGGVSVNDTIFHAAQENLPFGGIGASGIGAYHGQTGFDTFSHLKPVFYQAKANTASWLAPPYGKRLEILLKILKRS